MGIYHFAPVGTSPGAVTSALAYLKQNAEKFSVRGKIIESVVIFASPEVRRGHEGTADEPVYNDYESLTARRSWKKGVPILEVIVEFIRAELRDVMPSKGKIYCCVVDPSDYDACFEQVAKAVIHFAPPKEVGKHIWANVTGGTNLMNAALLQVAFLSGLIVRLYYTFLSDFRLYGRYLQPPSTDPAKFRWDEIPVVKTTFDQVYYALLQVLKGLSGEWYLDEELLARLRQASGQYLRPADVEAVSQMDIGTFRREFLNKLDERELDRQHLPDGSQGRAVRVSEAGRRLLERIDSPFFQALIQRGHGSEKDVTSLTEGLQLEELWSKP